MAGITDAITPSPFVDSLSQSRSIPWLGNLRFWQVWLATGGIIGGAVGKWGGGQRGIVQGAAVGAWVSLVCMASFYPGLRAVTGRTYFGGNW